MVDPVRLPTMPAPQEQSWHALMDVYDRPPSDRALVGGQLVHLHCAERGARPSRPTNDADAVLDVRASPDMLQRFTSVLRDLGFDVETSGGGLQHRWRRADAQIDLLIPEGTGRTTEAKVGVAGGRTVAAPGTTQALRRAERVRVEVGGKAGTIIRPTLVGALVGKAAARLEITSDAAPGHHCVDFVILAGLVAARDFRETELSARDLKRLRGMIDRCSKDQYAMSMPDAERSLDRVRRGIGQGS